MTKLSRSPQRNTFQKDCYIKRCEEEGSSPTQEMLDFYDSVVKTTEEKESKQGWGDYNLEYDLRSTDWILIKVRESESYAQNLYAALCNNDFRKIGQETEWFCSWRYAGGIVANMLESGDYIDWYCSGIRSSLTQEQIDAFTQEQKEIYNVTKNYVCESDVTEEIKEDLQKLGWEVISQ